LKKEEKLLSELKKFKLKAKWIDSRKREVSSKWRWYCFSELSWALSNTFKVRNSIRDYCKKAGVGYKKGHMFLTYSCWSATWIRSKY